MSKHTPGPWTWGKGIDGEPERCYVTQGIEGRPRYLIATIENGAAEDFLETEEANARLIAAAPDLLDALLEFMGTDKTFLSASDTQLDELIKDGNVLAPIVKKARAAIAKAKGETP